jgi:hypothetical protein
MYAFVRWRIRCHAHACAPWLCRPDRPRRKTAAAVRADVEQFCLDAIGAERALIGADARFGRSGRQVLVAIFAVREKLQGHGGLVALMRYTSSQEAPEKRMPNFPRFAPLSSPSAALAGRGLLQQTSVGAASTRMLPLNPDRIFDAIRSLPPKRREVSHRASSLGGGRRRVYPCAFQALTIARISAMTGSRIADCVRENRGAGAGWVTPCRSTNTSLSAI